MCILVCVQLEICLKVIIKRGQVFSAKIVAGGGGGIQILGRGEGRTSSALALKFRRPDGSAMHE